MLPSPLSVKSFRLSTSSMSSPSDARPHPMLRASSNRSVSSSLSSPAVKASMVRRRQSHPLCGSADTAPHAAIAVPRDYPRSGKRCDVYAIEGGDGCSINPVSAVDGGSVACSCNRCVGQLGALLPDRCCLCPGRSCHAPAITPTVQCLLHRQSIIATLLFRCRAGSRVAVGLDGGCRWLCLIVSAAHSSP